MKEQQKHGSNWPGYLGLAVVAVFGFYVFSKMDPFMPPHEAIMLTGIYAVIFAAFVGGLYVIYRMIAAGVRHIKFLSGHQRRMAELREEKLRRDLAAK